MTTREQAAATDQSLSLTQRRAHLTLPLAERRKQLAAQAARMVAHYEQVSEPTERLARREGVIVEP